MAKIIGGPKEAKKRIKKYILRLKKKPISVKYDGWGSAVDKTGLDYFYLATFKDKTKRMLRVYK